MQGKIELRRREKFKEMAKILVIEDEGIIALDLQRRLQARGYEVVVAYSGEQALAEVTAEPPDLVLMDIYLQGGMDGIEAATLLRERFHLPVIFLTAFADEKTLARARLADPFAYLVKPVKNQELYSTLEIVLYRHRMEEELYKVSQALEQSRDAVLIADPEGIVEYVNAAFLGRVGQAREALVGKQVQELESRGPMSRFFQELREAIASRKEWFGEIQREGPGGELHWEELAITPILDKGGYLLSFLAIAREITARRKWEQEQIRLERLRALEEMIVGLSHNLNNILTGVLLPAQMLQVDLQDSKLLQDVEQIIASSLRARDLVQRLVHTISRGREERVEAVSVNEVVREVMEIPHAPWREEAQRRQVSIEVTCDLEEVPPVRGTRDGLRDLLLHLLLNAVEAMPAGGKIALSTRILQGEVSLCVQDTGIGMDEESRRRIFEPFFTTKATVNSGLGLSLIHGLVTRWGGSIEVESKPGQGATFAVHLPLWQEPDAEVVEKGRRHYRILLVDDEPVVHRVLLRLLAERFDLDAATDGQEALRRFAPGHYDAAMIDLSLPDMSGDQLAQELRRLDPGISTVMITGWILAADDPRRRAFDYHLQKPLEQQQVEVVLEELLSQRPEG